MLKHRGSGDGRRKIDSGGSDEGGGTGAEVEDAAIAADMAIVAAVAATAVTVTETVTAETTAAAAVPTVAEAVTDAAAAAGVECDRCKRVGIGFHIDTKVSTYLHRILFVYSQTSICAQIKVPRVTFICVTNRDLRMGLTICNTNEFVQSHFLDGALISYASDSCPAYK